VSSFASYVICTSPRSGSTLLCSLLASTGVAGTPESYFHRPSLSEWAGALGVAQEPDGGTHYLQKLFEAAQTHGTTGNGVFGLRLQRDSFAFLFQTLHQLHPDESSSVACFERVFGPTLFVHLSREDKLAQAISLSQLSSPSSPKRTGSGTSGSRTSRSSPSGFATPSYQRHQSGKRDASSMHSTWRPTIP